MTWAPSDALVEKAARFIDMEAWAEPLKQEHLWPLRREMSMQRARAALLACRDDLVAEAVRADEEPTQAMYDAADMAVNRGATPWETITEDTFRDIWRAMLKARHP